VERLKEAGAFAVEDEAPGMLPVAAAAKRIGRTPKAVRHLIDRKELLAHRCGRRVMIDRAELEQWIRANTAE
jgi:excisionase family DNA binding protein